MYVPNFFRRQLKIIDPELFVVKDESLNMYDIWKIVNVELETRFKHIRYKERRLVASYRYLNDDALANLRYRKWLGNKFETGKDPRKYLKWLKDQEKEERKKKIAVARDMQAKGWMKIYNTGRRKMFT